MTELEKLIEDYYTDMSLIQGQKYKWTDVVNEKALKRAKKNRAIWKGITNDKKRKVKS